MIEAKIYLYQINPRNKRELRIYNKMKSLIAEIGNIEFETIRQWDITLSINLDENQLSKLIAITKKTKSIYKSRESSETVCLGININP